MKIAIYTITSPLHNEQSVSEVSSGFISDIENESGISFEFRGADFSEYGTDALDLIYIRTGGTEGIFRKLFPQLKGRILLLTSGKSNSLAASLEILSYLRQNGRNGEIIHGSTSSSAATTRKSSKHFTDHYKSQGQTRIKSRSALEYLNILGITFFQEV